MSFINYSAREINLKIVILGGIGAGGGHPLEKLYDDLPATSRGKLTSLKESGAEVLFFDCLPDGLEPVRDFRIRVTFFGGAGRGVEGPHLKLLLKGADGVIVIGEPEAGELALEAEGIPYVKAKGPEAFGSKLVKLVEFITRPNHKS